MLYNIDIARQIADFLLEIKAVILRPEQPFKWASGWNSPIYCDNRLILSEPDIRDYILKNWADAVQKLFPETTAVAGVATAGIAHAAIIADHLHLPMAYVRSKPKEHGTEKLIEGRLAPDSKAIIIEDLISTGKSSLQAVDSVRQEGIAISGLMSIFTYGFQEAETAFAAKDVKHASLCEYDVLIGQAIARNYVREKDLPTLQAWRKSPSSWGV